MITDEKIRALEAAAIDAGKLIEAGWLGYRLAVVPREAGPRQVDDMRACFFAGAQHLLTSVIRVMSGGDEITEADERRMANVHRELHEFIADFNLRHKITGGAR